MKESNRTDNASPHYICGVTMLIGGLAIMTITVFFLCDRANISIKGTTEQLLLYLFLPVSILLAGFGILMYFRNLFPEKSTSKESNRDINIINKFCEKYSADVIDSQIEKTNNSNIMYSERITEIVKLLATDYPELKNASAEALSELIYERTFK